MPRGYKAKLISSWEKVTSLSKPTILLLMSAFSKNGTQYAPLLIILSRKVGIRDEKNEETNSGGGYSRRCTFVADNNDNNGDWLETGNMGGEGGRLTAEELTGASITDTFPFSLLGKGTDEEFAAIPGKGYTPRLSFSFWESVDY